MAAYAGRDDEVAEALALEHPIGVFGAVDDSVDCWNLVGLLVENSAGRDSYRLRKSVSYTPAGSAPEWVWK